MHQEDSQLTLRYAPYICKAGVGTVWDSAIGLPCAAFVDKDVGVRISTILARQLAGKTLAITFVTVGELTKWRLVRNWGPQRKAGMQTFLS